MPLNRGSHRSPPLVLAAMVHSTPSACCDSECHAIAVVVSEMPYD